MISEHAVLVALVREYLAAHPGATIQQTACACGASRQTIDRALKVCVGQPFRSLRNEYRFRALAALVAERPPLLVKEIAFALGFSTARSFARWARRVDGRAPRELQRALKR